MTARYINLHFTLHFTCMMAWFCCFQRWLAAMMWLVMSRKLLRYAGARCSYGPAAKWCWHLLTEYRWQNQPVTSMPHWQSDTQEWRHIRATFVISLSEVNVSSAYLLPLPRRQCFVSISLWVGWIITQKLFNPFFTTFSRKVAHGPWKKC